MIGIGWPTCIDYIVGAGPCACPNEKHGTNIKIQGV